MVCYPLLIVESIIPGIKLNTMTGDFKTADRLLLPAVALLLMLLFAWPVNAQQYYYQYTDDNGHVHFTDDLGAVPEDKRSEIKQHRSVPSSTPNAQSDVVRERGSAFQQRESAATGSWEMNLRSETDSLERERAALKSRFEDIQSERNALGEPPPPSASRSEKERYEAQVKALNRKIDAYEKRRKAFDERVSQYRTGRAR